MEENSIDMTRKLFSVEDMEKCFIAGKKHERNIDNPTVGEYILPLYKKEIEKLKGE